MADPVTTPATSGWRTKWAGILSGVYAVIAIALYFIKGPAAPGALGPSEAIPMMIAGLGLVGVAGKFEKLMAALKS